MRQNYNLVLLNFDEILIKKGKKNVIFNILFLIFNHFKIGYCYN